MLHNIHIVVFAIHLRELEISVVSDEILHSHVRAAICNIVVYRKSSSFTPLMRMCSINYTQNIVD
jgi:hypothetical protein